MKGASKCIRRNEASSFLRALNVGSSLNAKGDAITSAWKLDKDRNELGPVVYLDVSFVIRSVEG